MQSAHCQRCKKAVATVHLTEVDRNGNRERHLCDRCAAEEGLKPQQSHVSINELLTSFVLQQSGVQQLTRLTCSSCGATFADFRNLGLMGCPGCYDAFETALLPLLERAHNDTRHVGKAPRSSRKPTAAPSVEPPATLPAAPPSAPPVAAPAARSAVADVKRLRKELDAAVAAENFELAARLRDSLKALGES